MNRSLLSLVRALERMDRESPSYCPASGSDARPHVLYLRSPTMRRLLWCGLLVMGCAVALPARADYIITDLGYSTYAFGINASGQVVGTSQTSTGANDAFLYSSSTGMIDLNTFLAQTPALPLPMPRQSTTADKLW
ncbi:MAG TPA: hypothetical protein VMF69_13955 [Gemmataceae bacterium]|nr:hypothetical protein [Gemmataceae bacterium]